MLWFKNWLRKNTIRIEIFENHRQQWQWRLRGWNGEILAHSEEYSNIQACQDTIKMLEGKKII